MEEIRKEKKELVEKYQYLKGKLTNYKDLIHRSNCPCCEQKIDYNFYESKIPGIESKMQEIDKRLDEIIPIIIKLDNERAIEDDKKHREHRKQINEYITLNKPKLNKAIRDYNKGVENYLPSIPDSEKPIWNEAIEWHLDSRNLDENEELEFEISG